MCVQVCPTGIDIRKGLQYECIACAACIDACDGVMDKMQYPRGLIRYSTQHAMEGRKTHVVRPRMVVYATLLTLLCGGFVAALLARTPLDLDVIRDRNALYRESRPGYIENVYTLRIINKDNARHTYDVRAEGLPTLRVETDPPVVEVGPGEVRSIAARALVEDGAVPGGGHTITFRLTASDAPALTTAEKARLFTP
jgi:cytochrome c oxidase accessory protein FixG